MGRPPVGPALKIRLPEELRARAVLAAARLGITLAELIRRAVEAYVREL